MKETGGYTIASLCIFALLIPMVLWSHVMAFFIHIFIIIFLPFPLLLSRYNLSHRLLAIPIPIETTLIYIHTSIIIIDSIFKNIDAPLGAP